MTCMHACISAAQITRLHASLSASERQGSCVSSASLACTTQDARIARAAAQRCRDRDEGVRRQAFDLLGRLPLSRLRCSLQPSDWQGLFDCGLAGPPPAARSRPATRHAAMIRDAASELLQRFLGLHESGADDGNGAGKDGRQAVADVETVFDGACNQAAEGTLPAWQRRLQQVLPAGLLELGSPVAPPLPGGPAAAVAAQHLLAAWRDALREVLPPEQLAAVGLSCDVTGVPAEQSEAEGDSGAEAGAGSRSMALATSEVALERP